MSERLLSYEFIGPRLNTAGRSRLEEGVLRVAQIFRALRCCLENLQSFYATLSPSTARPSLQSSPRHSLRPSRTYLSSSSPRNSAHQSTSSSTPRLPPYKAIGPAFVSFTALDGREYSVEYIARIAPDYPEKALFRAHITVNDQSEMTIIKFTHKYCTEAHQLLAALQPPKAPKLFFSDFVSKLGVHVVVMGYVRDSRVTVTEADTEDIRVAVAALHEKGLVLGDLRQPNVLLLPEGGVNLIDFDWCGKENTVTYPADIFLDTSSNDRHEGTQRHGLIKREHDVYMFERLTGSEFYLS